MNHTTEEPACVKIPCFLDAVFAMTYTGQSVPSCGLMAGDLVCLNAASQVADGSLAAIRDGEENLLGRLLHISNGVALVPLDTACPPRIFIAGKDDPPCIVGEVTGWVHRLPRQESDREGGAAYADRNV